MAERYQAEHTTEPPVTWFVRDTETGDVLIAGVPEGVARTFAQTRNLEGV